MRHGPKWLDELNGPQRLAVTYGDGPLLVIAGAGTGKTRTLACRVAFLIEQGISPDRILLLTFTRRASVEMISRARRYTSLASAGKVWGGTFHSVANRLLREYGRAIGLEPNFTVMDQSDAADQMNLIRSELGLSQSKRRFPRSRTLATIYSRAVNSRTKLPDLLETKFPWCQKEAKGIREVFEQYRLRKRAQNVLDYDDLLLYWEALCGTDRIGPLVADRFDHILVDEYQDTNVIQAQILKRLRPEGSPRNLTVVGDDAQSIYSFRAATVRNILDFPEHFAGARIIKLEQNYRSVQPILDASNAVMEASKQRYEKALYSKRRGGRKPEIITCTDEDEQSNELCDRILGMREEGVPLRQQAVLFRAGHHSDRLEVELNRRNIPFVKYGGLKFVEAAHIKDMIAFLRILENPMDRSSWFRVLQLLDGIGPITAGKLIGELLASGQGVDVLGRLLAQPPRVPSGARESYDEFRETIKACRNQAEGTPAVEIERIRRFYEPILEMRFDNPQIRMRDLEQLELIAAKYRTRSEFITDLTLDPPNSTQDLAGPPLLDDDYLILSTMHSAKGLEWNVVHIIHAADGMIPSDMATGDTEEIEEERRLLYVAMTRARNTLHLFFPLRYYHRPQSRGDRHSYAQLTRFITKAASGLFERSSTKATREFDPGGIATDVADASEQIGVMLTKLWD